MQALETDEPIPIETDDLQDHIIIQVDRNQGALRIDSFLNDRLAKVSRTRIQNAIKAGAITVDGLKIKPNYKIQGLQKIEIILPHHEPNLILPENIPLDIVYEDADMLIVNKVAGMVVHPGVGNPKGTLLNALSFYLNQKDGTNGFSLDHLRPGLVHRIDKETSGLLVIAKNEYALSHLAKQFFDHSTRREYYALVWGEPEQDKGTINMHIGRHPKLRQLFTVFPEGDQGKHAITHFEVIERWYYVSLIKCRLETGRTHQIRVHMQSIGHPVFNDERYGGDRIVKGTVHSKYKQMVENIFADFPRHALHAKSLGLKHPVSEKDLFFESELPPEFLKVVDKWKNYVVHQRTLKL